MPATSALCCPHSPCLPSKRSSRCLVSWLPHVQCVNAVAVYGCKVDSQSLHILCVRVVKGSSFFSQFSRADVLCFTIWTDSLGSRVGILYSPTMETGRHLFRCLPPPPCVVRS